MQQSVTSQLPPRANQELRFEGVAGSWARLSDRATLAVQPPRDRFPDQAGTISISQLIGEARHCRPPVHAGRCRIGTVSFLLFAICLSVIAECRPEGWPPSSQRKASRRRAHSPLTPPMWKLFAAASAHEFPGSKILFGLHHRHARNDFLEGQAVHRNKKRRLMSGPGQ